MFRQVRQLAVLGAKSGVSACMLFFLIPVCGTIPVNYWMVGFSFFLWTVSTLWPPCTKTTFPHQQQLRRLDSSRTRMTERPRQYCVQRLAESYSRVSCAMLLERRFESVPAGGAALQVHAVDVVEWSARICMQRGHWSVHLAAMWHRPACLSTYHVYSRCLYCWLLDADSDRRVVVAPTPCCASLQVCHRLVAGRTTDTSLRSSVILYTSTLSCWWRRACQLNPVLLLLLRPTTPRWDWVKVLLSTRHRICQDENTHTSTHTQRQGARERERERSIAVACIRIMLTWMRTQVVYNSPEFRK